MAIHIFGYDFGGFDDGCRKLKGCERIITVCSKHNYGDSQKAASTAFLETGILRSMRDDTPYEDFIEQIWKVGNACRELHKAIRTNWGGSVDQLELDSGMRDIVESAFANYVRSNYKEGSNYATFVEPPLFRQRNTKKKGKNNEH